MSQSRIEVEQMSVAKPILNLYNTPEGKPGLMTLEELCAYISVNKSWVYQHIRDIPHFKLCGLLRFRQEQIDAWLESQEVTTDGSRKIANSKGSRQVVRRRL